MALISLHQICFSFGGTPLLNGATLSIEDNQRIALLGRNGQGKSTLFNLITQKLKPESGEILFEDGLQVGILPQEVIVPDERTIREIIIKGLGNIGTVLWDYEQALLKSDESTVEILQNKISKADAWELHADVDAVINRFELNENTILSSLSAGWRRRVSLARAVINKPKLLLLDEPTNHLDIASIQWLEKFIANYDGAVMLITHDRYFMNKCTSRILDLDRGNLSSWDCSYYQYLQRREHQLEVEEKQAHLFDKKLANEETWIRKGIKARRTRNEGRVRALEELRKQRAQRRERSGTVRLEMQEGTQSGKLICQLKKVSFSYPNTEEPIFSNLTTKIMRGDRIGIIGNNGTGKTTLIKTLLGELQPTSGEQKMGSNLQIVYFDQNQACLNPESNLQDVVANGGDWVEINGRKLHYKGYLKRFLFDEEHQRSKVKNLSGGERNRLLLAQLFTKPCNVLVLDEPTNDLDMETLELLEELVEQFSGTLILVSHDRAFVNNTVSSILLLDGDGLVHEYIGGYDDAIEQHQPIINARLAKIAQQQEKQRQEATAKKETQKKEKKKKLSYMAQREFDALPEKIENLEEIQTRLTKEIENPDLYTDDGSKLKAVSAELKKISSELETAYERWSELEEQTI